MTRWTTLPDPNGPALVAPGWANDATKALAAEAVALFDTTRTARAEAERLHEAAKQIDPMTTSVADLSGAAGMAQQSTIESLRDEIIARSKFAEFLVTLEVDRRRAQIESAAMVDQAKQQAKAALLSAGFLDLSQATVSRGGGTVPDHEARAAFDRVLNSFPGVLEADAGHGSARTMAGALIERAGYNRRHREEAEASLRKMLETLAAVAVA